MFYCNLLIGVNEIKVKRKRPAHPPFTAVQTFPPRFILIYSGLEGLFEYCSFLVCVRQPSVLGLVAKTGYLCQAFRPEPSGRIDVTPPLTVPALSSLLLLCVLPLICQVFLAFFLSSCLSTISLLFRPYPIASNSSTFFLCLLSRLVGRSCDGE